MAEETLFRRRRVGSPILALIGALTIAGCALGATEQMKKDLARHGQLDGDWQIRDEANKETHTYVLLRTPSGIHETYEIVATDGQRAVTREQVGGIDRTGCFLTAYGVTTPWVLQKPDALQESRKSGDDTRTKCLEYKETVGWNFIPAADRKAAEPPPPAPKPAPDAGMPESDGGTPPPAEGGETKTESKGGEVKSALGL